MAVVNNLVVGDSLDYCCIVAVVDTIDCIVVVVDKVVVGKLDKVVVVGIPVYFHYFLDNPWNPLVGLVVGEYSPDMKAVVLFLINLNFYLFRCSFEF